MKLNKENEMKLTPWIDGSIKPVRAGVYEREYGTEIPCYCEFDGSAWHWMHHTVEGASGALHMSPRKNLPWRGIAEQPKEE